MTKKEIDNFNRMVEAAHQQFLEESKRKCEEQKQRQREERERRAEIRKQCGEIRKSMNKLYCPICGEFSCEYKIVCLDDDGDWRYEDVINFISCNKCGINSKHFWSKSWDEDTELKSLKELKTWWNEFIKKVKF